MLYVWNRQDVTLLSIITPGVRGQDEFPIDRMICRGAELPRERFAFTLSLTTIL
jgi:hypothetical protein